MQASSRTDTADLMNRLVADALPGQRGLSAWQSFLRSHASLMRELATDLVTRTGVTLNDFDVLAQLAFANGELRMTDLAARAYSSRSGMTRRVDRLVDEGLVERTSAESDARGVVVALTDTGFARLQEALPVHVLKVSELFIEPLGDEELEVLERALAKVTPHCEFG